ncbi:MAG: putative short chain dehydrogenase [Modestobacter sp.]|nr:putative short chain dehydrogenase [Modestobacter sp.]
MADKLLDIGGLVGLAAEPGYCATKGAVVTLTRQLAVDFAPERINVDAVRPGFLATAMVRTLLEDPELDEALLEKSPWPELGHSRGRGNSDTLPRRSSRRPTPSPTPRVTTPGPQRPLMLP